MKLVVLLAVVAFAAARPEDLYQRYENFDVSEIISNDRLFTAYGKCFSGTGKCTPEGSDIKQLIPESIQNTCEKCSEKQKGVVAQFIKALQVKLPEIWGEMKKTHDPEGKYIQNIPAFIEKYGN